MMSIVKSLVYKIGTCLIYNISVGASHKSYTNNNDGREVQIKYIVIYSDIVITGLFHLTPVSITIHIIFTQLGNLEEGPQQSEDAAVSAIGRWGSISAIGRWGSISAIGRWVSI